MENNLYTRKLFSELDYTHIDLEYKKVKFDEYKPEFQKAIDEYLENNPDVKEKYDEIIKNDDDLNSEMTEEEYQKKVEENRKNLEELDEDEYFDEVEDAKNKAKKEFTKDPDIKRIYREIVKATHPDKLKGFNEKKLNKYKKYYLEATEAYENQELYSIVRVATLLDLDIGDLSDENLTRLENDLAKKKMEISGIEGTVMWKYMNADNKMKDKIMTGFIDAYIITGGIIQ